jgi:hypothetical protein
LALIVAALTIFCGSSQAQFAGGGWNNVGGPFIDDRLVGGLGGPEWRELGSGGFGGAFLGPQFGLMNPIGQPAQNALQNLTSFSTSLDNEYFMLRFAGDSGLGNMRIMPTAGFFGGGGVGGVSVADGLQIGLGPLTMSDFYAGAGMFYTDYDTSNGIGDDSGWSSVLTLSSQVSLWTPLIFVSARLQGYYLPMTDEWGWGLPGVMGNFGAMGIWDPGTFFVVGLKGTVGGWDYIVYDIFTGDYLGLNFTDAFFDGQPNLSADAIGPASAPIHRVGRYGFGGAYLDQNGFAGTRQNGRFSNNLGSYLSGDRLWFVNSVGTIVGKLLTPTTRSINWLRRDDFWATSSFNSINNFITGGSALEMASSPYSGRWAGYEFGTFDEFDTVQHTLQVGAWGYLSPNIGYSASIGYLWNTGTANDQSSALYDLFLMHFIGSRFIQYLAGGRTLTDPTFGERFVNDYIQYGVSYLVNRYSTLQAVTGYYQTDGSLTQTSTFDAAFAGIRLRHMVGQRSFFSISTVAETFDFQGVTGETNQWNHRFIYAFPVGRDTFAYTGYQYIERNADVAASSFTEHLLLFYLVHRF